MLPNWAKRWTRGILGDRIAGGARQLVETLLPPDSQATRLRDAHQFWSESSESTMVREQSHWLGHGTFADREAWRKIGQQHFKMFKKLCALAEISYPVTRMVEWGPGGGANAVVFARHIPHFAGVDVSKANLEECARQLGSIGADGFRPIHIPIDRPEACLDSIGDDPCDFFLSTAVFQHFPSKVFGVAVTELAAQMLRPQGVALIQTRYEESGKFWSKTRSYSRNFRTFTSYTVEEYWKIAVDSGFECLCVRLDPSVNYAYYFLKKSID